MWEEQTADLTAIPTDTHAVHFSFTGSGSANLFNWDWWQFNEFTSEIEATPLSTLNSQLSTFYTLQGIPVINPTKGIYVKDGRKVVIP